MTNLINLYHINIGVKVKMNKDLIDSLVEDRNKIDLMIEHLKLNSMLRKCEVLSVSSLSEESFDDGVDIGIYPAPILFGDIELWNEEKILSLFRTDDEPACLDPSNVDDTILIKGLCKKISEMFSSNDFCHKKRVKILCYLIVIDVNDTFDINIDYLCFLRMISVFFESCFSLNETASSEMHHC